MKACDESVCFLLKPSFSSHVSRYYPWNAPFRRMWRALKHGNRQRIVGYNPYYFPSPTTLQDFIAGELSITDVPALRLNMDSLKRVRPSAPGWPPLHATYATTLEQGDWTFLRGGSVDSSTGTVQGADLDFSRPFSFPPLLHETGDLLAHVMHARDRGVWPIFNVLISQEGTMNPAAIKQLADVADGLATSRKGILLHASPPVVHLPPSLARTGPAMDGPIFWRQNAQLVGWERGAFAAWLVDARECKSGVRVTVSSPCQSASLADLSASLLPQHSCRIASADDDADDGGSAARAGGVAVGGPGGWICDLPSVSVPLQVSGSHCDAAGSKHAHATLQAPSVQQIPIVDDDAEGSRRVWLVVALQSMGASVRSKAAGGCDARCSDCGGIGSCYGDGSVDFVIESGAAACV